MAEHDGAASSRTRPSIDLPSRNIFTGDASASPGPMTLVSSFFSENDPDSEYRSFSQLLAGAMGSPVSVSNNSNKRKKDDVAVLKDKEPQKSDKEEEFRFPQNNRPGGLVVSQSHMFTVPPGLSPTSLFDSPRFFAPPTQGPFGMSHQQALAQVTLQAAQSQSQPQQPQSQQQTQAQSQSQFQMPNEYPSSMLAPPTTSLDHQPSFGNFPLQMPDSRSSMVESSIVSYSDPRSQPPLSVDKPAEDGYNWRKYGQKQVKGSEYPRSYYKCTHPNCPVKKKVERSLDGHVTEIIYKGQHNHQPPQHVKRTKDGNNSNGRPQVSGNSDLGHPDHSGNFGISNENAAGVSKFRRDQESSQVTPEQLSGSSDGEEVGNAEIRVNEDEEDQPDPKRRNTEVRVSEPASSHRAVTEPRIIVQTTSEVDLLDDGYRWRKYGQKVVKGNPHPRSYYKCTSTGCNVRKHVERAATDIKAVITTYEGKHNHDVPAAKHSSHTTANSNVPQIRPHNPLAEKRGLVNRIDYGGSDQQTLLRFKEEQVT